MAELTEWELELELEGHVQEHGESLMAIDNALAFDPENEELLLVREELLASVKGAKESLLHLKRTRLLLEVDALSQAEQVGSTLLPSEGSQILRLDTSSNTVTEGEVHRDGTHPFFVGSKCRFRYINGRWYNGKVISVEDTTARVVFLNPTNENMQICRFYLQQRCRFGGNCRLSHGTELPLHALRPFMQPKWEEISVGSTILACDLEDGTGLWRQAELESWDAGQERGWVVFISDGKRMDASVESLAVSEHAIVSDSSDSSSEEDEEDIDDIEIVSGSGIGVVQTGQQTDTVSFAKWEKHTRGMASRMMANMGYREGMGLGKAGQGQVAPIEVQVLPAKQSLGFMKDSQDRRTQEGDDVPKGSRNKKSRGGKRKRYKKWAAAAFAAKVAQDQAPDVFDFINLQLAGQRDADSESRLGKSKGLAESTKCPSPEKKVRKEDRLTLVAHEDEMFELRARISKLGEMAYRNRKEKAVYESVNRKLEEARQALVEAEAAHASATSAVHSKDKERKWLRF